MTTTKLILSLDQGTTSSRAIVFDENGMPVSVAQQEFTQHFPQSGWVEHDPEEIWQSTLATARAALTEAERRTDGEVISIGITNQRETILAWNIENGQPVCRAIVWQDRRTAELCQYLKNDGHESLINEHTGLTIDPYFSGTKLRWILENVPEADRLASDGKLAFGTVDTFLLYRLPGG